MNLPIEKKLLHPPFTQMSYHTCVVPCHEGPGNTASFPCALYGCGVKFESVEFSFLSTAQAIATNLTV